MQYKTYNYTKAQLKSMIMGKIKNANPQTKTVVRRNIAVMTKLQLERTLEKITVKKSGNISIHFPCLYN